VNKGQLDAETAARIADVDAEEARALAAEGVLDDKIDQEVQDRIADVNAEEAARIADVNAEEAARIADVNAEEARALLAENVLQGNINLEAAARASEDTVLHNRINQEQSIRAAEDASIRNEFRAADQKLGDRISTNTRGIAMVAAMTNTTVQPGMKQAVDFNVAQFEGETGFAFGYSYRVNENLQIQGAGATTTDVEESVVRLGMSYQW
jgi:polyhydroxyalkanoate synthesis regulator phasin